MPEARSTSPNRRQDRPIESVELKISFKASREAAARIREFFPSAVVRNGACVVTLKGEQPGEVGDKARELLEKVRELIESPKGLK